MLGAKVKGTNTILWEHQGVWTFILRNKTKEKLTKSFKSTCFYFAL